MIASCPEISNFVTTLSTACPTGDPVLAFCVPSVAFVLEVESFSGSCADSSGLGGRFGGLHGQSQSYILSAGPYLSVSRSVH